MTYDDPSLNEFSGYLAAKEHIEGRITQTQARRRIHDYYEAKDELKRRYLLIGIDRPPPRFDDGDASRVVRKGGQKRWSEKGGQKMLSENSRALA